MCIESNESVNEYLDNVCALVKNKKVHESIKDELLSHITDISEEYIENGEDENTAINKAISKMGSAIDVGEKLDRVHRAVSDWILIGLTSVLALIGLFTLWSLEKDSWMLEHYYSNTSTIAKTSIYIIVGAIFFIAMRKFDYRSMKKHSKTIYTFSLVLLFANLIIREATGESSGFLCLGDFSINIIYLSELLLIISLSGIFEKMNWNKKINIMKGITLAFIPLLIFLYQISVTNVIIYSISVIVLIISSGLKPRYILISLGSIGSVLAAFALSANYRIERIRAFLDKSSDPLGTGWVYNKLNLIRNSSNMFGRSDKLEIKEMMGLQTEFILSYIMYAFGIVACAFIIVIVFAFIVRICFVGKHSKDGYGRLLVYGFCAFFGTQFILNILMNFSMFPVTDITMPFISYGGSSVFINIISLSIISSVYKWRNTPFREVSSIKK